MPDLGVSGGDLTWLALVAVIAGLVRGFAGFGTALIYVPLASLSLPPLWVLVTLTVMDLIGPLPAIPKALRDGQPRQVALLAGTAAVTLLPGLWLLDRLPVDGFRWLVAVLCLLTVGLMVSGWRWSGQMTPVVTMVAGGTSGFLGGLSGLAGPPVILTYMSAPLPAVVIRANLMMFLVAWDGIFGTVLFLTDRLTLQPLMIGAALLPIHLLANWAGARIFAGSGRNDRAYRAVAYILIVGAALLALPL
ncbi:sulfite exporter TauE/SafE family protein [Jannaschia donghaensis]|uniref:Probable membrane transporter protein n=1 Tax=Jannaschia donghaensis TaxID=420998 RepID=A0A0M6YFG7_9RHOB|nr:sulfite exporter TauE/SafE family protein [Jannaschia donghaensis]CTQ48415.1 Sulfite exporter TauE/SafE [Jannaschia donghaensis]